MEDKEILRLKTIIMPDYSTIVNEQLSEYSNFLEYKDN